MKRATAFAISALLITFAWQPVLAQEEGDYRTRGSGDWSNAQNWQVFNGSTWGNVATAPTGSETITIMETDSIFVDTDVTITGRLVVTDDSETTDVNDARIAADGTLTIGDGGVFQHDRDEGTIPQATWGEGSVLHLTGVTATAPADRNQSYHHVIFDTPGQLANLNMDLDEAVIGGDIRVLNTGFGRWYLTSADPRDTSTVTIMGDVIVDGVDALANELQANFSVHGTSNAETTFIVDHYGDVTVTDGNFSISRGSQGLGTTTWNLHEGDFIMEGGTTQNSTITPGGARFVFSSGETQTLSLSDEVTVSSLPIEVAEGTTLDMGTSALSGSGDFEIHEGAVLGTAQPGGVAGVFDSEFVGEITLHDNSGYLFNGTEAQVTSERMPATVGDLIIDNEEGVTLSQETTINGTLRLVSGVFDNTVGFTLGSEGTISEEGGSLLEPVSAESDLIPQRFFVDQNYPNPFNPATTIRFGLPDHSQVTVTVYNMLGQRVATVHDGSLGAGVHEFPFNAEKLSSGVYLYRVQTESSDITKQMVLMK